MVNGVEMFWRDYAVTLGITDLHDGNYRRLADGRVALIDIGFGSHNVYQYENELQGLEETWALAMETGAPV